jgi:DNA-binding transcriptional ArsR family regulator
MANGNLMFKIRRINFIIVILQLMGITKSEIYTEKQNKMAIMLKALAHPARIAIIEYLINSKSCICGDLVEELGLAQATISQHLKELKTAGIIKGTVDGASVCYCIDEKVWKQYKDQMDKFFVSFELKNNCC